MDHMAPTWIMKLGCLGKPGLSSPRSLLDVKACVCVFVRRHVCVYEYMVSLSKVLQLDLLVHLL